MNYNFEEPDVLGPRAMCVELLLSIRKIDSRMDELRLILKSLYNINRPNSLLRLYNLSLVRQKLIESFKLIKDISKENLINIGYFNDNFVSDMKKEIHNLLEEHKAGGK